MAEVADVCVSIAWSGMACNMLLTDAMHAHRFVAQQPTSGVGKFFYPNGATYQGEWKVRGSLFRGLLPGASRSQQGAGPFMHACLSDMRTLQ